jgi:hypothetical protein
VRSVEFHPEAQDEFISAAQFYERETQGLGLDFIATVQSAYERLRDLPASGAPFGRRLRDSSFQSFRTVFSIASSLSGSTSLPSCTFTAAQVTGGHDFETVLPDHGLERFGSTRAAQPVRSAQRRILHVPKH